MTRRRLLIVAAVIAVLIAAPIGWYLISPLFINRTVSEAFPAAQAAPADMSHDVMSATTEAMASHEPMNASAPAMDASHEPMSASAPAMDASHDAMSAPTESMGDHMNMTATPAPTPTPAEPVVVRQGMFHDVEHAGSGTATIYRLPDGKHVLRFENFKVLNGPDLYVYVSAAPDANDERTVTDAGFVSLGRLKGNIGEQNYELPADFDLSRANSVSIWCQRFTVNFATAPLQ